MRRVLSVIVLVAACIGAMLSIGMLIMAVRFGELGRVLVYGLIAIVCIELSVFSFAGTKKKKP